MGLFFADGRKRTFCPDMKLDDRRSPRPQLPYDPLCSIEERFVPSVFRSPALPFSIPENTLGFNRYANQ
jgi:hypothetical protein